MFECDEGQETCPTCSGRGWVEADYYRDGEVKEQKKYECESCDGTGCIEIE